MTDDTKAGLFLPYYPDGHPHKGGGKGGGSFHREPAKAYALEECEKMLAALQAVAREDEPHLVKVKWFC